jgi:Protein of unknown function (DUF3558)
VTRWTFALLVAALGLSGCTTTSTGSPLPTRSTTGGQTTSNSSTTSDDAAAKLASIDPCTLLSQAQLGQYGLSKHDSGDLAGSRHCAWAHLVDASGKGGYVVGAAIWDQQGITDVNADGYSITDVVTGRHQARQGEQTGGDGCFVAIGVTDSTRVDVVASGDPGQGCTLANQFAKLIEPRLPGGAK